MKTKGLTIQEAVQSGLPFKREGLSAWHRTTEQPVFSIENILAQDWEIKVPEVTITREKLEIAIKNASAKEVFSIEKYIDAVAKELGI